MQLSTKFGIELPRNQFKKKNELIQTHDLRMYQFSTEKDFPIKLIHS